MGVVGVETIKKAESEAYLLINPRPVNEEYTKYSFPSKYWNICLVELLF